MSDASPIGFEVPPVECQDPTVAQSLGGDNERSVGEVHRMIGIVLHQLESANESRRVEEPDGDCAGEHEGVERGAPATTGREEMECFGEDRYGRVEPASLAPQRAAATVVAAVAGIEQSDQRAGVDQDQRRCFRRIAARIARLASLDGAIA